jgi:parallel beta-helix repeat protein
LLEFSGIASIKNNTIIGNTVIYSDKTVVAGGIGGRDLSGATLTISNNEIYSHVDNSAIGFVSGGNNTSTSITISGNTLDNSGVTSNGNYGIEISGSSGDTAAITGNTIKYFGLSGIRLINFDTAGALTIQTNTISSCGTRDYVYANGADMGNGNLCTDADGCPAASGIQLQDSHLSSDTVTGNTIRYNAYSGIALTNTDGYIGPDNILENNGNTSDGGGGGGGSPSEECPEGGNGPGSGDGAIAVKQLTGTLTDTLVVSDNVIENNLISSVSRKDCTDGTVRLNGREIGCGEQGNGYWTKTDAKVYIDSSGIYVDSVKRTSDLILDCTISTFSDLSGGITGGKVWGVAIVGSASGVVVRNCVIDDNMTSDNNLGPQGISMGGGILVGPGVEAQIYSNSIYNNGFELAQGSGDNTIDSNTATEWITPSEDTSEPHWIKFDLAGNTATQVKIWAGAGSVARTWDVYIHDNKNTLGSVVDSFTAGGGEGWYYSGTFSASGNYLTLQTSGGWVGNGDMIEFRYNDSVSGWTAPELFGACTSLFGGNSGVTMRCTGDVELWNNDIYSNWNHGIELREVGGGTSRVKIGPNNDIHNHVNTWGIGLADSNVVSIVENDVYLNMEGVGLWAAAGDVLIYSNIIRDNGYSTGRGIGLNSTNGDLTLSVRKNQVYNQLKNALNFQDSPSTDTLNLYIYSNNVYDNGKNGFRMKWMENATVELVGNTFINNGLNAIQFKLNENITLEITGNNLSSNTQRGMRFRENEGMNLTIASNTIRGNNQMGIRFEDNTLDTNTNPGYTSVFNIRNNTITDNKYIGVEFRDNSNLQDVYLYSNYISGNSWGDNWGGVWLNYT